jgi:hypothetical protein
MRRLLAFGYIAWAALFNLPIGIWAVATGHYIVGGVFLALTVYGLGHLIVRAVGLGDRFANPS